MSDNQQSILGIGNDIIEIERIRQSFNAHPERFLNKLFTPYEQEYCLQARDPAPSIAARFAAKEAIAKALGVGFGKDLSWLDLEIRNDAKGKPFVSCSEGLKKRFNSPSFLLSLSHCKTYATAVVLWLGP